MVSPMTFACAAESWSISFAITSRDHGQRPMFAIDCSSMAITAMRSLGGLEVMRTPTSYAQRSTAGMNPAVRANPKSTTAMTRPKNQSAFQNAVFIASPWSRAFSWGARPVDLSRGRPSYRGAMAVARRSPAAADLRSGTLPPREPHQVRGDDEVLDRHALRFEEGDLVARGAAGTNARDHLADLGER